MTTLKEIEQDPMFAKLTFEEQVSIRQKYLQKNVFTDPDFLALSDQDKSKIINATMFKAPVLEDKNMQRNLQSVASLFLQGDENAAKFMQQEVLLGAVENQFTIMKAGDKFLLSPWLEANEERLRQARFDHGDIVLSKDQKTVIGYFDMLLSQDDQIAKRMKVAKPLLSIAGAVADFAIIYGLTAGTAQAPKMLGKLAVAPGRMLWEKAGAKTVKFLGKEVLPTTIMRLGTMAEEAGHAVATSLIGVARENVREFLNDENMDGTTRELVAKNARWFGGYFLGDIAMNMLVGYMLPMAKSMGKTFTSATGAKKFIKSLDDVELQSKLKALLGGDEITMKEIMSKPVELRSVILSNIKAMKTMQNVTKATPDDYVQMLGAAKGFGFNETRAGIEIYSLTQKGLVGKGKTWQEVGEILSKNIQDVALADMKAFELGAVAGGASYARSRIAVSAVLNKASLKNQELLARMVAPVDGKFTEEGIRTFSHSVLKAGGVDDALLQKLRISWNKGAMNVQVGDNFIARVSAKELSPEMEVAEIRNLFSSLKKFSKADIDSKALDEAVEGFVKPYALSAERSVLYTPAFMNDVAVQKLGMPLEQLSAGRWKLGDKTFASFNDAGDYVLRRSVETSDLSKYLYETQGFTVREDADTGRVVVRRGATPVYDAASIDDLLTKHPELTPKMSKTFGPTFTIIDNNRIQMDYTNRVSVGSYKETLKFLDNFKDYSTQAKKTVSIGGKTGRVRVDMATKHAEVELPDIAYRRTFNNSKDAMSFMRGWEEYDSLKQIAFEKGYRLDMVNGRWMLYGGDGKRFVADELETLKKQLKEAPIPEHVPELTGADDALFSEFAKDIDFDATVFKPDTWFEGGADAVPDYRISTLFGQFVTPPRSLIEKMVREGGNPEAYKWYEGVEEAGQFIRGEEAKFIELIQQAFYIGKKPQALKKRIAIQQIREAQEETTKAEIIRRAKLTPDDLNMIDRIETVFGKSPEEGFAGFFGVRPLDFLNDYFPRIRKVWTNKDLQKKVARARTKDEALSILFEGSTPPPMDAFFKHQRVSDVLAFARIEDPMQAMITYAKVGLKEKYFGPILEKAAQSVKKGETDALLLGQFRRYLLDVSNMPQGMGEKTMREITPQVLSRLGIDPTMTQDLTKLFMSGGYLSLMGFRPWLPIRNMQQIFTMLAPRVGNDYVKKAMKIVANDADGAIFQRLRKAGIMSASLPLYGSEMIDSSKFIGKLTHKGLEWYKNSDDYTRAVAYVAAEERFKEGAGRFLSGRLGSGEDAVKRFSDIAGWRTLSPAEGNKIKSLLAAKQFDAAQAYYAKRITELSMFPYRSGTNPLIFNGTFGKIFGMMGHYPVYYVDNLRRMVQNMSPGEIVTAGSTFVANSMALYGFFKYVTGIEAKNFLPWNPALFGGGPFFDISVSLTQAIGGGDQEKSLAISKLFGISHDDGKLRFDPFKSDLFKTTIPGAYQMRSVKRAVEEWNKGNVFGFLDAAISAPQSPDDFLLNI